MSLKRLTLKKIHAMLPHARLLQTTQSSENNPIQQVSTDSRKIAPGDFFIALRGDQFDGHQFVSAVFEKGAQAVLIDQTASLPPNCPALLVDDTRRALQEIATVWRKEIDPKVIVVTGSNGKTTVKEMLASIFQQALGSEQVLSTAGNFNNEIGLPLTLLRLKETHRVAIIELGMNHAGETQFLAGIAQPDMVLINNAQREHQEFMHTVAAVAIEHADAITSLSLAGLAVFPADSLYTAMWQERCGARQYIDFALGQSADAMQGKVSGYWISAGVLRVHLPQGQADATHCVDIQLATLGDHNAKNALAAAAVAFAAGISALHIVQGLEKFRPVVGRMQSHALPLFGQLGKLVDDTYNANPDSVLAAIDMLSQLPGKRWLVLGDMGEVGSQGQKFHTEIGEYAKTMGIENMYATGDLSVHTIQGFVGQKSDVSSNNTSNSISNDNPTQGRHFSQVETLLQQLKSDLQSLKSKPLQESLTVLVKGSRFTKMERVVQHLLTKESPCC